MADISNLPNSPVLPSSVGDGTGLIRALYNHITESNNTVNSLIAGLSSAEENIVSTTATVNTQYWQQGTYTTGDLVYSAANNSLCMECTTGGVADSTEPAWTAVGTTVTDGTVQWLVTDARDARKFRTARNINGVPFDGSEDISITQVGDKPIATTDQLPETPSALITIISDTKASGTAGGAATSGSWLTRVLNTKDYDGLGITLASNQFTLLAGTYKITGRCPLRNVDQFQARIQNITDGTTATLGTSEYSNGSTAALTSSQLSGVFTISASKVFELQYRCTTTCAATGLGVANTFGINEVYSKLEIQKLA